MGMAVRELTKEADSELRRLLFNAAMQGRRSALWEPHYLALRARGMNATTAFVALGRKLARVCFALLNSEAKFDPNRSVRVLPVRAKRRNVPLRDIGTSLDWVGTGTGRHNL